MLSSLIGGDNDAWWNFFFAAAPVEQRRALKLAAEKSQAPTEGPIDIRFWLARMNTKKLARLIAEDEKRRAT